MAESHVRVKVFTEGWTEYHYVKGLKNNSQELKISIEEPRRMEGGGYSAFLNKLKKTRVTAGYVAVFVIIDYDKTQESPGNMRGFNDILKWCQATNKSGAVPYFVIVTNPRIEYFACLHSPEYKNGDEGAFITRKYSYQDLDKFKNDSKVFHKLTTGTNSIGQARKRIALIKSENRVVYTHFTSKWKGLNYQISAKKIIHQPEKSHIKSTNFDEFFEVVFGEEHK